MGVLFCCINKSLATEKCLQPKNPLLADSGDGCTAFNT